MTAFLLSLALKFWPVIAAVAGGLWWGIRQRRAGAASERAKIDAADKRVRDIADEIQNDVGAMSPEQIDAELRKRAKK